MVFLGTPRHPESVTLSLAHQIELKRWVAETVALWRRRFGQEGVDCLWEVTKGRGRKPVYDAQKIKGIIDATLQTRPKGATHWSCRTLGRTQGRDQPVLAESSFAAASHQALQAFA